MVIICCAHDYHSVHCFNIKISFKILFPGSRPTCNSISSVTKTTKHKMDSKSPSLWSKLCFKKMQFSQQGSKIFYIIPMCAATAVSSRQYVERRKVVLENFLLAFLCPEACRSSSSRDRRKL